MRRELAAPSIQPFGRREHYLPTFDGWRGIAAFAVIFAHQKSFAGYWFSPLWEKLRQANPGTFGVSLFFALSGFLITYLMLVEKKSTGAFDLSAFWIRRIFRIVPLAWFYIAALGLITLLGFRQYSWGDIPPAVLFYYNYLVGLHRGGSWSLWHFWTLGVEMQFYLFWALAVWLSNCRRVAILSLGFALAIAIWRTYVGRHGGELNSARTEFTSDSLFMGAFFGAVYFHPAGKSFLKKWLRLWSVLLVLLTVVFVTAWKPHGDLIIKPGLYALLLTGTLLNASSALFSWLEWPLFTWLGRISFSIYVWQELFTGNGLFHTFTLFLLPLSLVGIVLTAWLSYRCIEVPGIRMGARIIRKSPRLDKESNTLKSL